jgi:Ca-activated chloride channel family protein
MRRTLPIASLTFLLACFSGCSDAEAPQEVIQLEDTGADSVEVADVLADPEPTSSARAPADKRDAAPRAAEQKVAAADKASAVQGVPATKPSGTVGIGRVGTLGRGSGNAAYGAASSGVSTSSLDSVLSKGGASGKRRTKSRSVKRARVPGAAAYKVAARSSALPTVDSRRMAPGKKSTHMARKDRMRAAPMPDPVYNHLDEGGTFQHAGINPFTETREDKLSTFAIDVDTASYTYARRFLNNGTRPNPSSVRVEEWVNAFHYAYNNPTGKHPFGIEMEAGPSPLDEGRHILRVGIQGKKISAKNRKPVHLTFLVDTSGSMSRQDKLPLAQRALHHLVDNLKSTDSVALITYAGSTSQVLPQTSARHKSRIHRAIDGLRSGGGTAMGTGMEMAYRNAGKFVAPGSVSRVIVLSDGDANIGRTSHDAILQSVKGYVSEGIKLSTVGFGTGNYRDHLMEQLADAGDGNYSYIDSFAAAKKVFGTDLSGTLQVIAKDVKIQVEMNPKVVKRYRLLGYENRDVADRDFRNDKVDAGEIGAGHSVTALYEVELVDPYAKVKGNVATVRVRYKQPRGTKATEVSRTFTQNHVRTRFGDMSRDTRWASAVSLAAEVLRGSPYTRDKTLEDAWALAAEAAGGPYKKERRELVDLLDRTHRREALAVR